MHSKREKEIEGNFGEKSLAIDRKLGIRSYHWSAIQTEGSDKKIQNGILKALCS
jgi:hypothetical protein